VASVDRPVEGRSAEAALVYQGLYRYFEDDVLEKSVDVGLGLGLVPMPSALGLGALLALIE
jgi:hypothetical protein